MKTILHELKEIEAQIAALIQRLEAQNPSATAAVSEIRRLAVLEEVYRTGGAATPQQISDFAKKYGKNPSSCAGYFSGKKPSLAASEDRKYRCLTGTGERLVREAREKWGDDWLDRLPMDIVGNQHTPDAEVSF